MDGPDPPTDALLQRGFRYALALTHDRPAAEDLLHDAWIKVRERRKQPSVGYLFVAIRHRWIDELRRRAAVPMGALPDHVPASGWAADAAVGARDELDLALAELPADEREALFLHAAEGWTAAEIGHWTGRPRNTILTVLARARHRLTEWRAARADREAL